jgi:hypothetical protein
MAPLYEIAGEFTEYSTAIIEATDGETARQIWYQNIESLSTVDVNVECNVEDEGLEGIDPELTMDDYDENGPRIA